MDNIDYHDDEFEISEDDAFILNYDQNDDALLLLDYSELEEDLSNKDKDIETINDTEAFKYNTTKRHYSSTEKTSDFSFMYNYERKNKVDIIDSMESITIKLYSDSLNSDIQFGTSDSKYPNSEIELSKKFFSGKLEKNYSNENKEVHISSLKHPHSSKKNKERNSHSITSDKGKIDLTENPKYISSFRMVKNDVIYENEIRQNSFKSPIIKLNINQKEEELFYEMKEILEKIYFTDILEFNLNQKIINKIFDKINPNLITRNVEFTTEIGVSKDNKYNTKKALQEREHNEVIKFNTQILVLYTILLSLFFVIFVIVIVVINE